MSQITLELNNYDDEQLVLTLLQRLGIHYSMQNAQHIPNKETLAAIEEARNGNLDRYTSLEAMWADLDSD